MLRVLIAALPGLLALLCTVLAVGLLFGWPWALLAAVPFLLVVDHRASVHRQRLPAPTIGAS